MSRKYFKVLLRTAFVALLLASPALGGVPALDPPEAGVGAHKLSGPGPVPSIPNFYCVILITDNSPPNSQQQPYQFQWHVDRRSGNRNELSKKPDLYKNIAGPLSSMPVAVYKDVGDWNTAISHLSRHPDGDIMNLILNGHGNSGGGIETKNPDTYLSFSNLTDKHIAVIKSKLHAGGQLILLGCECGKSNNLLSMSKKLGVPVIANTGRVAFYDDMRPPYGEGNWVVFRP
jgi:hypothetical protein